MYIDVWQVVACLEILYYDEDALVLNVVISLVNVHKRKLWQQQEAKL